MERISVRILILEAEESDEVILQELYAFLSKRTTVHLANIPSKIDGFSIMKDQVLSFTDLELHINKQAVYKNGVLIPMSHHEFFTLCFLARHPGWVFTKQQIYEAVWQTSKGDSCSAVTNIISQIRKKLNPDNPKSSCIKTVVNSGYKFEV